MTNSRGRPKTKSNGVLSRIQFETVNLEYLAAIIFLGAALIMGVIYGLETTAGNIASGMIGYIGGRVHAAAKEQKSGN